MTAAEEIRAAIDKLTELWSLSNDEQFKVTKSDGRSYMGSLSIVESVAPEAISPIDAELIVTLHRTIDAQLVMLNSSLVSIGQVGTPRSDTLALARAINGVTP